MPLFKKNNLFFSKYFLSNRFSSLLMIFTGMLIIIILSLLLDHFAKDDEITGMKSLKITQKTTIPLREISGLYIDPEGNSNQKIYFIGDHSSRLGYLDKNRLFAENNTFTEVNLSQLILDKFSICHSELCKIVDNALTSQWESLTRDSSGRFYLFNEILSSVFVVSKDLRKLLAIIALEDFPVKKKKRKINIVASKLPRSNMGEGLVLLDKNKFLVVKEKDNPELIEFSAADPIFNLNEQLNQKSEETTKDSYIRISYKLTKRIKIEKKLEKCDLSEMTKDSDHNIYLLSQQCRFIGKIEDLKKLDAQIIFKEKWRLPPNIKKAESLAVLSENKFIVGEDIKSSKKPNIFHLEF